MACLADTHKHFLPVAAAFQPSARVLPDSSLVASGGKGKVLLNLAVSCMDMVVKRKVYTIHNYVYEGKKARL
jgi:hypothetical protein